MGSNWNFQTRPEGVYNRIITFKNYQYLAGSAKGEHRQTL